MNRVNGCPCGETNIHLFKGADSTTDQENRKYILIFLKGTIAQKKALKRDKPSLYAYCEQVWQIRKSSVQNYWRTSVNDQSFLHFDRAR